MTRNEAPVTTNYYALSNVANQAQSETIGSALRRLGPLMAGERRRVGVAFIAIIITSGSSLLAPLIIGHTVDTYIQARDFPGVLRMSAVLLGVYVAGLFTTYLQTITMGTVGRRVLFNLRNALFTKLQQLPVDFFNQNKAGDLI